MKKTPTPAAIFPAGEISDIAIRSECQGIAFHRPAVGPSMHPTSRGNLRRSAPAFEEFIRFD